MNATLIVILIALIIDRMWGEPEWIYRRVPHPVVLMGKAIDATEARLHPLHNKKTAGVAMVIILVGGAFALGTLLAVHWIIEALLISTLLAQKSLLDHVRAVAHGLRSTLSEGRQAVANIVGRDPKQLDRPAVARAGIESLAENLADGVIAPLFWALLLGLPGIMAYKMLNTLDSMIGHKNDRYLEFGWASARLDDLANLIPARLTGLMLCATGMISHGKPIGQSIAIMNRSAPGHNSPNAGYPEAAMAAVLDFKLAGPRIYAGQTVDGAWMGEGRADLDAEDIEAAVRLCRKLLIAVMLMVGSAALLF